MVGCRMESVTSEAAAAYLLSKQLWRMKACVAAWLQAIQHYGRLEKISIYNNAIGSAGCKALVEAVKANRNLKVVEFLPGNCAPTRDIKLLAQAVK